MEPYKWKRFDSWFYLKSFKLGVNWLGDKENDEAGMLYQGWELTFYLGPWTFIINGKDRK